MNMEEFIKSKLIIMEDPPHIAGRLYSVESLKLLMEETARATIEAVRLEIKVLGAVSPDFVFYEFDRKAKAWLGEEAGI